MPKAFPHSLYFEPVLSEINPYRNLLCSHKPLGFWVNDACLFFNVDGAKIHHQKSFFQISSPKCVLFGYSLKANTQEVPSLSAMVPKYDISFKTSLKAVNRQFKGSKQSD